MFIGNSVGFYRIIDLTFSLIGTFSYRMNLCSAVGRDDFGVPALVRTQALASITGANCNSFNIYKEKWFSTR